MRLESGTGFTEQRTGTATNRTADAPARGADRGRGRARLAIAIALTLGGGACAAASPTIALGSGATAGAPFDPLDFSPSPGATAGLYLDIGPFIGQLNATEAASYQADSRRTHPRRLARPTQALAASPSAGFADAQLARPLTGSSSESRRIRLYDGVSLSLDRQSAQSDTDTASLNIEAGDAFARAGRGLPGTPRVTVSSGSRLTFINQDAQPKDPAAADIGFMAMTDKVRTSDTGGSGSALAAVHLNGGAQLSLGRPGAGALVSIDGTVDRDMDDQNRTDRSGKLEIVADFARSGELFSNADDGLKLGSSTLNMDASFDLDADATFNSTISNPSNDDAWQAASSGLATFSAGSKINLTIAAADEPPPDPSVEQAINPDITLAAPTVPDRPAASPPAPDALTIVADIKAIMRSGVSDTGFGSDIDMPVLVARKNNSDAGFARLNTSTDMDKALARLAPGVRNAMANGAGAVRHAALFSVDIELADWRFKRGFLTGLMFGDGYQDVNLWAKGFGRREDQADGDQAAGYTTDSAGGAVGGDVNVNDHMRVGAAVSYATLSAAGSNTDNDLGFDSYLVSVYGQYQHDWLSFDSNFTIARNRYSSNRSSEAGTNGPSATGRFFGKQLSSSVSWSRRYVVEQGGRLQPRVGLGVTHLELAEYADTGSNNPQAPETAKNYNFVRAQAGASFAWDHRSNGLQYQPELSATLSHDFGDIEPIDTTGLAAGSSSIARRSTSAARNALQLGASMNIFSRRGLELRASYDLAYRKDYHDQSGKVTARINF